MAWLWPLKQKGAGVAEIGGTAASGRSDHRRAKNAGAVDHGPTHIQGQPEVKLGLGQHFLKASIQFVDFEHRHW